MIDLRKAMIAQSLRVIDQVILSGIYRGHVTIMIAHRSITYCSLIDHMAQNTDLIVVRFPMEGYTSLNRVITPRETRNLMISFNINKDTVSIAMLLGVVQVLRIHFSLN